MDTVSAFQLKCPLSKRKFWKKILERSLFIFILSFLAGVVSAVAVLQKNHQEFSTSNIVLTTILSVLVMFVFFHVILFLTYGIYVRAYIRRYYYDCSNDFVTIKKGVFAVTEIHVQYQKIQDVFVDQDLIDRILGLYDVHIASTTMNSNMEAHIDGVDAAGAEYIKTMILGKISRHNSKSIKSTMLNSKQKISSESYPISDKWLFLAALQSLFLALFFTFIILGVVAKNLRTDPDFTLASFDIVQYGIIGFIVIFFLCLFWNWLWKKNYFFEFLPDYIQLKTGIISKSESHLPYRSIQDVTISRGLFNRMLGLSTVIIKNAAQFSQNYQGSGGIVIIGQPREKAEELSQYLNKVLAKIGHSNNDMGV